MKKQKQQKKAKLSLENLKIESFATDAPAITGGHVCWSEAHSSCAGGGPC